MDPGLHIIIQHRTDKIFRKFKEYFKTYPGFDCNNTLKFFI